MVIIGDVYTYISPVRAMRRVVRRRNPFRELVPDSRRAVSRNDCSKLFERDKVFRRSARKQIYKGTRV